MQKMEIPMSDARLINFPKHEDVSDILCVYQCGEHVPFDIQRVFTIAARKDEIRGNHAHKKCTQLLVCLRGQIRAWCDDGASVTEYMLDNMGVGLLVPPGVWAREEYLLEGTVLMVLCDRGYEPDDYIRDYNDYKTYIRSRASK